MRRPHRALGEGGQDIETEVVDPWDDPPELLAGNPSARVPTLITDDGQARTESLPIVLWLEKVRPEPTLLEGDPTTAVARAGVATGVIDAAAHTIISRRIAGPEFDESAVGLRRRRTMIEGLRRLDGEAPGVSADPPGLPAIAATVALDYIHFRLPDARWLPKLQGLERLRGKLDGRPSIERTMPYG